MKDFRLFQTERVRKRQFQFEDGKKFSRKVENAAGKGEIARYKQFLLFPQCFQKICTADMCLSFLATLLSHQRLIQSVQWKILWEKD